MKLVKFVAHSGIASRRNTLKLIISGYITVNNNVINISSYEVQEHDIIRYGSKILEIPSTCVWRFHKPYGYVVTKYDPQERRTIFDLLPNNLRNLIAIGRLDFNSEGLLLLTNDGDFARRMELPQNKIPRVYKVRVFGYMKKNILQILRSGVVIDGMRYQPIDAEIESSGEMNHWIRMMLTEGKNREIRRIMEHFQLKVSKLIRVGFGEYELGNLRLGGIERAHS